jgi:hypothetical protein
MESKALALGKQVCAYALNSNVHQLEKRYEAAYKPIPAKKNPFLYTILVVIDEKNNGTKIQTINCR